MGEILLPRRQPAQARSRERFERILQAARAVLVDVGFESFTVDEVAHRAGVPIGTLYQYFANKYVLVCELDRQDTAASRAEIERFSRRAVWHAVQSTPATRATAADTERQLLCPLSEILSPLAPSMSDDERIDLAGFLIHSVVSQLNYATAGDPSGLMPWS